ncbi:MAG: acyl-CoA thioesterase [Alistipes sp.]|nr:acyl-CoA thioesterase [Alistipes sp.]
MDLVVTTAVQMRFSDIDSFGHVNNLSQQAYFDLGKVELFDRLAALTDAERRVPAVLVSLHTEFIKQIRFGDDIRVVTEIEGIGRKSLTVFQRIMRGEEECARCRSVMVTFDKERDMSVDVPEEWRAAIGLK